MKYLEEEKKDDENIIEIQEEVKIPGSDIILEKGDRIEVLKENYQTDIRPSALTFAREINKTWDSLEREGWNEMEAGNAILSDISSMLESVFGGTIDIFWR